MGSDMKLIDSKDSREVYIKERIDSIGVEYGNSILLHDIQNRSTKYTKYFRSFLKIYKDEIQKKAFQKAITKIDI